ncbi:MAG: hypothetical protein ACP5UV_01010, partial [Thermoplasmata archaeon]
YGINTSENISFLPVQGYYLNLSSYLPNQNIYTGYYTIIGNSSDYEYAYSSNASMSMFLPEGKYYITSSTAIAGIDYAIYKSITLTYNYKMNLKIGNGTSAVFLVYNKAGNVYEASTAINNGIAILYSHGYPVTFSNVSSDGSAIMIYPNSTADKSAFVESVYFAGRTVSVSSSTTSVGLSPVLVNANLTFTSNGRKISNSGTVTFDGQFNYTLPMVNGSVSGNILPGAYKIFISNDTSVIKYGNTSVSINGKQKYIPVQIYAYLNVSAPNTMIINRLGHVVSQGLLPLGNYTIYSVRGYNVSIGTFSLRQNYNFTSANLVPFKSGYILNVSNSLGISGLYTIESTVLEINTSHPSEILLPPASYKIIFSASGSNDYNSYYANGSVNIDLISNENVTVPVSVRNIITELYVNTGQPASKVYLYRNGTVYSTSISGINGTALFNVPTGSYGVYVITSDYTFGYTGSLTIPSFTNKMEYNASLKPAYAVKLFVAINNKPVYTDVNISLGNFLMTVNSTVLEVYLPLGNYTFSSQLSSTVSYESFSTYLNYSVDETYYIHSIYYVSLYLQKESEYSFLFSSNTSIQSINVENRNGTMKYGSVTYNFTLVNTGNVPVNVTLSSQNSNDWNITFKKQSISTFMPGQSVNETAIIVAEKVMPEGKNAVPIAVNYSSGVTDENLYVMFPPISQINVSSLPSALNGTDIEIPVSINNTGNTNLTVALSINSTEKSSISLYGYNVTYPHEITVLSNSSKIVNITLIPTEPKPYPTVSFLVNVTYDSKVVNLHVEGSYPQLSKINIAVTGTGIIPNYTLNPYTDLYIGLGLIAVIVVAGLVVTAYKGRRKK